MYKSFLHVEKIDKPECDGLLNNIVYVSAKVDATNACVWSDDGATVLCGSRKRQLSENKDNAGFYNWVHSDNQEAIDLRCFVKDNPGYIVYGEWMANFVGHIKDYNEDAKQHMYIFDVFNLKEKEYLAENEWRQLLADYGLEPYFVELLAVIENPTMEELLEIAKNNKFLLDNANHPGEGIVIKAPGWKNKWGNTAYGKIVLEEYIQKKKEKKPAATPGEVEKTIADVYVTNAELSKAVAKTCVKFNTETFNNRDGKYIGFYLNILWKDIVEENIMEWLKKYKMPTINFRALQADVYKKAKDYIGL